MSSGNSVNMHLAFVIAANSIMRKGDFNADVAVNSLRIFRNTVGSSELSEAVEAVLKALDDLNSLGIEDRRSRAWQDQKLVVQDAFRHLHGSYSKWGSH